MNLRDNARHVHLITRDVQKRHGAEEVVLLYVFARPHEMIPGEELRRIIIKDSVSLKEVTRRDVSLDRGL